MYDFKEDGSFILFMFYKTNLVFLVKSGKDQDNRISFFSEANFKIDLGDIYDYSTTLGAVLQVIFEDICFIHFAKVETKLLQAGKKIKDISVKYLNETKSDIQILDSTWFTTLVKSDVFKVRGHFRLQPKKDKSGQWTKELTWINEFQKNGYTREAGKLKN